MDNRLDIILFGATGFTGRYAIPYLEKFSNIGGRNLSWGVAGRSEEKLKQVLSEMSKKIEKDLSQIPIILTDIKDVDSIKNMASRAKLIMNCCGPYRFYGEPVVKACVEMGTSHVDVSGEPQYMEKMILDFNKLAEEKGIYIVSACGFDSVPADLGTVYLQQKFEGTLNCVETFIDVDTKESLSGPLINYGTWETAVHGLAHWNELRELRRKLYPQKLPTFTPKLQPKSAIHKSDVTSGWCVPFLGSDRSVALRTQRYLYEKENQRPAQIHCYLSINSILSVVGLIFFGGIFKIMTQFSIGRKLLLNYPKFFSFGLFSHDHPSEENMKKTHVSLYIFGQGWSEKLSEPTDEFKTPMNKSMVCKVSGYDPGYGMTCLALVLSGIMILTEKDKLPKKGGVYSPGAAFGKTSMIDQLDKNGFNFEVVDVKVNQLSKL